MNDDSERICAAIRAAAEGVQAPPELRERLAQGRPAPRGARRRLVAGALAAAGAIVLALVLVIDEDRPTVQQVARASLAPPEGGAAGAPRYGAWRPLGTRTDTVEGRSARTVIYRRGAVGAHYAVVDGSLRLPEGRRVERRGVTYALLRDGDVRLVAWHRDGKTCVLASRGADLEGMLHLAAYGS